MQLYQQEEDYGKLLPTLPFICTGGMSKLASQPPVSFPKFPIVPAMLKEVYFLLKLENKLPLACPKPPVTPISYKIQFKVSSMAFQNPLPFGKFLPLQVCSSYTVIFSSLNEH